MGVCAEALGGFDNPEGRSFGVLFLAFFSFFFFFEVVISSERRNLGCPSGWVGCSNRVAGQQCGGLAIQGIACGCMQYSVQ